MKKEWIIVNVAIVLAIIFLFILVLGNKSTQTEQTTEKNVEFFEGNSGVVYINTDSLIMNYEYARTLSELLLRKEESSRTDFNERARIFQNEMIEFNRKIQNNSFLSHERAQNEENRLRKKESELQELSARFTNELLEEQERMHQQLRDTITLFLKDYCKDKPYSIVLSNTLGDNILYSVEGLDITDDVVTILNDRYSASQKK
jgi:outer membrane protein